MSLPLCLPNLPASKGPVSLELLLSRSWSQPGVAQIRAITLFLVKCPEVTAGAWLFASGLCEFSEDGWFAEGYDGNMHNFRGGRFPSLTFPSLLHKELLFLLSKHLF